MTRAVETLTLVEQDASHPLLALLGLRAGEAAVHPVARSSTDEWAQEARRLELQGKARAGAGDPRHLPAAQARAVDALEPSLIEELAPKALDPRNPSSKPRQTLFDYALWHAQNAWIERAGAVRASRRHAR